MPPNDDDDRPGGAWLPTETRSRSSLSWYRRKPTSVEIKATTPEAQCQLHRQEHGDDILVIEEKHHRYMVIVVDARGNWIVNEQRGDADIYAIPGDGELLSPFSGYCDEENDPYAAAQRHVTSVLSVTPEQSSVVREEPWVDQYGLPYGKPPTDSQWIFLGRYRTMAKHGGAFVYSYLHRHHDGVKQFTKPGVVSMRTSDLQQALLKGRFQELAGTATVSLALQHFAAGG